MTPEKLATRICKGFPPPSRNKTKSPVGWKVTGINRKFAKDKT